MVREHWESDRKWWLHLDCRHCLSFLLTRGSPKVSCHVILFTRKVNSCSSPYTLGRQTAQQKAINSHYTVHLASLFHLPWWGFLVRYRTWPNYNHHSQRAELKRAKWFLGQSESCFLASYWFIKTLYTCHGNYKKLHMLYRQWQRIEIAMKCFHVSDVFLFHTILFYFNKKYQ